MEVGMQIKILGSGCAKCAELAMRTEEAVRHLAIDATVEKVTDIREIMSYGVMITPALAVDGQVRFAGRVPTVAELTTILLS
jgi:small redox-active disulfide protein 2